MNVRFPAQGQLCEERVKKVVEEGREQLEMRVLFDSWKGELLERRGHSARCLGGISGALA